MSKTALIVMPSSYHKMTVQNKNTIAKIFEQHGYNTQWSPYAQTPEKAFGILDKEKITDLHQAFDQQPDIIMALRGGYGSERLLPKLNWNKIKKSKSLLVGCSDTTVLQNAYLAKTGKPSITGMIATFLVNKNFSNSTKSFFQLLSGQAVDLKKFSTLAPGRATGTLIGGNLNCFATLLGTPYLPKLKGKILLLEEVHEAPFRVDRVLTHLKTAGVFDQVSGVILGTFHECVHPKETKDIEVQQVLKNFFKNFKIPVVCNVPYGHSPQHICLPLGTKTTIDTQKSILHIDALPKKR